MADFGTVSDGQLAWNLNFRRHPLDHEISELTQLLELLDTVKLNDDNACIQWLTNNIASKDCFTVKTCCSTLTQQTSPQVTWQTLGLPHKWIWDSLIPARVNFFLWELNNQMVQTRQRLQQIFPSLDTRCVLCSKEEESQSHLFLN